jgi:hypothetical protein
LPAAASHRRHALQVPTGLLGGPRLRLGLPRGWSGANIVVDVGEAFLFRRRDEARVIEARSRHGINRRKLGRTPLVFAYVPYGE